MAFATGVPTTLAGSPVLSVYEQDNLTQITLGVSVTVDYDSITGLNQATIVATDANGYEAGKSYDLVITAGTVNGVSVVGKVVYSFTVEDAAVGSKIDNIGAASGGSLPFAITEDNTGGAIDPSSAVFVGSIQGGTTFANVEAEDGVIHDMDDVGNDIDIVYGTNVGGSRTAIACKLVANVTGNSDEMKLKAYDHIGADWEIIGTIPGSGGGSFVTLEPILLAKHTGTGSELGKVYLRLETDGTTPAGIDIDQLVVFAVNIGQSVGYANGQIWIDTVNGVAGTIPFTHGVADQPVDLIASAKTLSSSIGISDFHIINGSTITLAESTINESYFGDNWTLALGGQDVNGSYFQGAHVSGVGISSSEVHYEGCDVGATSVQKGHFDFCSFDDTVTHTLAGDYNYHNCYSKVAGVGTPTFAKTAGQIITAQWRNWAGSITVGVIEAGDVMTISGMELGDIVLNGVDGTVKILGEYESLIDNRTGSPSLVLGAFSGSDVAGILVDTNDIQSRLPAALVGGLMNANISAINTDVISADSIAADAVAEIQAGLATEAKQDIIDANVDAILIDTDTTLTAQIAALNNPTAAAIAAAVAAYDMGNGRTIEESLAFLRNKWTIIAGTLTVYDTDDITVLWTSILTQTAGNPVSSSDPA